jgi:hypothetical protein
VTIGQESIVARAPNLAQRLFEEEMLVITANDSMLHRFNEVGTYIWSLLEKDRTVHDILVSIEERFEGFDKKQNQGDILRFLEELRQKKLVSITS